MRSELAICTGKSDLLATHTVIGENYAKTKNSVVQLEKFLFCKVNEVEEIGGLERTAGRPQVWIYNDCAHEKQHESKVSNDDNIDFAHDIDSHKISISSTVQAFWRFINSRNGPLSDSDLFKPGDIVRIQNLKNTKEFNGELAEIVVSVLYSESTPSSDDVQSHQCTPYAAPILTRIRTRKIVLSICSKSFFESW